MTRDEMIDWLQWAEGGYGFGTHRVGNVAVWSFDENELAGSAFKFEVGVVGPPEKYADEELEELVCMSMSEMLRFNSTSLQRRGGSVVLFDKIDGAWIRRYMSWTKGPIIERVRG